MAKTAAERKRDQRTREKAEKQKLAQFQPTPQTQEEIVARLDQHGRDLTWAKEQDTKSHFYKSECRSCVDLLAIYEGANINEKESDEDDDDSEFEKKKRQIRKDKQVRPNPCVNKLTIRAILLIDNGIEVKIEPDQWEYETLTGENIN